VKILIADDHALFRDALKSITLSIQSECSHLLAGSLQETLDLLSRHPDMTLLLIDLKMPGMNSVDDIQQVRTLYPNIPMIVVSMYGEREIIQQAFEYGASGYIPKTYEAEQTKHAISLVLAGGRYVPEEILQPVRQNASESQLTRRQKGVLHLILKGYSNQEIADELYISLSTVKMHVSQIMQKHGVKSRAQLIAESRGGFTAS